MDKQPKVSIIVPIYKVEKFLRRCIESILCQTYTDYELILVEDGSPDNCPKICDLYAAQFEHIQVVHKENGGLSSARLAGFNVAQGEYILFVDSDDYIDKCMVEKLVVAIEENEADLSICSHNTVIDGNVFPHKLPYNQTYISSKKEILSDYILPLIGEKVSGINIPGFLCIRLLRRDLIHREFFVSERKYFLEDHVFDLLYADCVKKIAIVNESLYFYCVNRTSLSNCYRKNKWEMYVNLYQFYDTYLKERNIQDNEGRIKTFLLRAVFSCVDNAVLGQYYAVYKSELNLFLGNLYAKEAIKDADTRRLSLMQKLILLLLKLRLYSLLYYIRKLRLEKG